MSQMHPEIIMHHCSSEKMRFFILSALPIHTQSGQKSPDKFGNILLMNAFCGKHLMEKCLSEAKQQLSNKYFVNFWFILKLFSKV